MLAELMSELESRRKSRQGEFWLVVRKLAAGEKVAPAAVERTLLDSGKSPADLREAVELLTRRMHWHEQCEESAALDREQPAIQERIAEADRNLAAAEEAHREAIAPLQFRLEEIKAVRLQAREARDRLIESCPYQNLKAELSAATNRLVELRDMATELRRQAGRVKEAESDLVEAERHAKIVTPGSDPRRVEEWRERARRNREIGETAKKELPTVEKEVARLEREEATIYERMLQP